MKEKLRIFLVDDHVLVRDGIKALLEERDDIEVVSEASDGDEALEVLHKHQPDLLIADIRMPNMSGIELVKEIKKRDFNIKTLMLSMHDSENYVLESIDAGADGYLLKGSSKTEFLKALDKIMGGGKYFSGDVSSILLKNFSKGNVKPDAESANSKGDPFHLTKREKQILELVLEGKSNKEIGEALSITKRTTEVHRFNLMKKLNVNNFSELTQVAQEYNL